MSAENALVVAVTARVKADAGLQPVLGGRVYDEAPAQPTYPYVTVTRVQGRPLPADGGAAEHLLTLSCVSQYGGKAEARETVAALRALLDDAALELDGWRLVSLRAVYADTFNRSDMKSALGLLRLRAVTEPD